MSEPLGERVTAVEVSLQAHVDACEKMGRRSFALLIMVAGGVMTIAGKLLFFSP